MKLVALVFVGVVGTWVAVVCALAPDARACGLVNYREYRPPVRRVEAIASKPRPPASPAAMTEEVAAAEQRIDEGRLADAARGVLAVFPAIRVADVGSSPLEDRALHTVALAVVRADGSIERVRGFAAATAAGREANLEWAVATLRVINARRHDDPVAEADLGEALAKLSKHADEALAILDNLASRDLMGSAHAYAALSRLRAAKGDPAGQELATVRCEAMTKSPLSVCRRSPALPDARLAAR